MQCEAPDHSFASDNAAGVHPRILDAMIAANVDSADAYGADRWTARLASQFGELFGSEVGVSLCWGGTGANVVALGSILRPWEAVICPANSHVNTDECGAPEHMLGVKLIDVETPDGKLTPDIESACGGRGDEHHVQPAVVSITQSSEWGTLYSAGEIAALCDTAHRLDLLVHLDGARIANATAALGGDVRSFTMDAGVDVVSFGGTKAGMMFGEAVVFLNPNLGAQAKYVRKQNAQLCSKMRFISAQFSEMLRNNLWIELADHANRQALQLCQQVREIPGVEVVREPIVNSLFVRLPREAIDRLQQWSFFWDWDVAANEVRWMTSFQTTDTDIDRFVAGVRESLTAARAT